LFTGDNLNLAIDRDIAFVTSCRLKIGPTNDRYRLRCPRPALPGHYCECPLNMKAHYQANPSEKAARIMHVDFAFEVQYHQRLMNFETTPMTLISDTNSLNAFILRHGEIVPCKTAFIDARTPGSDQKENFCLIGAGVTENPDQVVHINTPHGFDVGAARQPKGCKNSHHSHDTEEVFVVHQGQWKFTWGEDGGDGEIILNSGDTISIPTQLFRGFENVGDDNGFLLSVLGHLPSGTPVLLGHPTCLIKPSNLV